MGQINWAGVAENGIVAGAGAGLGMLSDAIGGINARKNLRRQVSASKELADYNAGIAKEMWDCTNLENQVKHMKNAGLSVGLMAGGGGQGGTTASGGGSAGMPVNQSQVSQGMGMMLGQQLLNAQVENVKADTTKKEVETNKIAGADTDLTVAQISKVLQETGNLKLDEKLKSIDVELTEIDEFGQTKEGKEGSAYNKMRMEPTIVTGKQIGRAHV